MTRPLDSRPETYGCNECKWERHREQDSGYSYSLVRECSYHSEQRGIRALESIRGYLFITAISLIFSTFFLLVIATRTVTQ